MRTALAKAAKLAALGTAAATVILAAGQEAREDNGAATEAVAESPIEEIIIRGSITELRRQVWRAEEAVLARFNEINSDDLFDIFCEWRPRPGSRVIHRVCLSNSWRQEESNIGRSMLQAGPPPAAYETVQRMMQRRLIREMKVLLVEDDELRQANERLVGAQLALSGKTGIPPAWSSSRQIFSADALPFGADLLFEVQIGRTPWNHVLTERTFTITDLSGEIRKLQVECDRGGKRLEFAAEVEWTVPVGWNECTVRVAAKRATTFRLYEFAADWAGNLSASPFRRRALLLRTPDSVIIF